MHFHLLGNVVDVSLAYLHRGDERCISRRSWLSIMFHEVAGEDLEAEGDDDPITVPPTGSGEAGDDSVVHNMTSRSYPVVSPLNVIHFIVIYRRQFYHELVQQLWKPLGVLQGRRLYTCSCNASVDDWVLSAGRDARYLYSSSPFPFHPFTMHLSLVRFISSHYLLNYS